MDKMKNISKAEAVSYTHLFLRKKREITIYYFIMSFHFQKLRLNTSGILLQNAISALFCFPGMSILLDMSLAR